MNILGHKMKDVVALRAKPTDGWPDGWVEHFFFFAKSADIRMTKLTKKGYCFVCVFFRQGAIE